MYLSEIFGEPTAAPQQRPQAPQQGQEGSTNFKQGDEITYTNAQARPPTTYTGTIEKIQQYGDELWASVKWATDANGNYAGPSQNEWQQISKNNMINLHWARKAQSEQQAPEQSTPPQSQHTPVQRPPQAQQVPTQQ